MIGRELYSIKEARELLGGISRNSIYELLRAGNLPSVVLGCRRFIAASAITELIEKSTTSVSPSRDCARSRKSAQRSLPFCLSPVAGSRSRSARHTGIAEHGHVPCRKRP
jgi:excisionase family DNA binding protein